MYTTPPTHTRNALTDGAALQLVRPQIHRARYVPLVAALVLAFSASNIQAETYSHVYDNEVVSGNIEIDTGADPYYSDVNLSILGSTVQGYVAVGNYGGTSNGSASITIENSSLGSLYVSGADRQLTANDLSISQATHWETSAYEKGICIGNGASASFGGNELNVAIDTESTGSVVGVHVFNGAEAYFSANRTVIDTSAAGSSGKWGFGLLVNGLTGSKAVFDGGDVVIRNFTKNYTSQTLTVKEQSSIVFNNTGDILVESQSPFGVTVVDAYGALTFNNAGNVTLRGTIVPGDKTGQTNVVGIQGVGTTWSVTNRVQDFTIELSGAGVDNDGTTYSTGTMAITGGNVDFNFEGRSLTIRMDIASNVESAPPEGHTACEAYALEFDTGSTFITGENSAVDIVLNQGIGKGYGLWLEGDSRAVFNGNTSIEVHGSDASVAGHIKSQSSVVFAGDSNRLTGDVSIEDTSSATFMEGTTSITGNVTLSNEASLAIKDGTVNLAGDMMQTGEVSSGKGLTLTNGTLGIADGNVNVGRLSGENAVIRFSDTTSTFHAAASDIAPSDVTIAGSGSLNDAHADSTELMETLYGQATVGEEDSALGDTVRLESGLLSGEIVGKVGEDGSITVVSDAGSSDYVKSVGDATAANLLIWRNETNDLFKRLGDVRRAEGSAGSWARINAGSLSAGAMDVDDDFVSLQIGQDVRLPTAANIIVGGAFSYTDGDLSYDAGDGTSKIYGFSIYGSWFAENGQFVDVIAKYARLSTDVDAGPLGADFDSNAYSLSAEYGMTLPLGRIAWVEPQAELTYGYVDGQSFSAGNGIRAHQSSMDTLIGRIGLRAGLDCPKDRGSFYLHASVLHDFLGETSVTMSNTAKRVAYEEDFGDTWFEYGIGGHFQLTSVSYVYADVERTAGADVDEDWRANVGVRIAW